MMTQKVVSTSLVDMFPSDRLLELLTNIQLANKKVTQEELTDRCRDDFMWEIDRVITTAIRSKIHTDKSSSLHRLSSSPLSIGNVFVVGFALHLLKALTPVVGKIRGREEDTIMRFLYQELSYIGARREITDGNYEFAYNNGEYMICLRVSQSMNAGTRATN